MPRRAEVFAGDWFRFDLDALLQDLDPPEVGRHPRRRRRPAYRVVSVRAPSQPEAAGRVIEWLNGRA
jgi:hypothetical protein